MAAKISALYIYLISQFRIVCFLFVQLYSTTSSVGLPLRETQHHAVIGTARNLETTCCTAWYSCRNLQHEHFRTFECQSDENKIIMACS